MSSARVPKQLPLLLMLLLLLLLKGASAVEQRVLFLGNSFTYQNNLPDMYKTLCEALLPDTKVTTQMFAPGGYTLGQHAKNQQTLSAVKGGAYDFLVLQDQSVTPALLSYYKTNNSSKAVRSVFAPAALKAGAKVVLLETWGYRDGAEEIYDILRTYSYMQSYLSNGYAIYAAEAAAGCAEASIAKVGQAWSAVFGQSGSGASTNTTSLFYRLYAGDGKHPSVLGTFLAAHTLFATINTARKAEWLQYTDDMLPSGVPRTDALELVKAAREAEEARYESDTMNGYYDGSTIIRDGGLYWKGNFPPTPGKLDVRWDFVVCKPRWGPEYYFQHGDDEGSLTYNDRGYHYVMHPLTGADGCRQKPVAPPATDTSGCETSVVQSLLTAEGGSTVVVHVAATHASGLQVEATAEVSVGWRTNGTVERRPPVPVMTDDCSGDCERTTGTLEVHVEAPDDTTSSSKSTSDKVMDIAVRFEFVSAGGFRSHCVVHTVPVGMTSLPSTAAPPTPSPPTRRPELRLVGTVKPSHPAHNMFNVYEDFVVVGGGGITLYRTSFRGTPGGAVVWPVHTVPPPAMTALKTGRTATGASYDAVYNPYGTRVFVATGSVEAFDLDTLESAWVAQPPGVGGSCTALEMPSFTQYLMAACGDAGLVVFDIRNDTQPQVVAQHFIPEGPVTGVRVASWDVLAVTVYGGVVFLKNTEGWWGTVNATTLVEHKPFVPLEPSCSSVADLSKLGLYDVVYVACGASVFSVNVNPTSTVAPKKVYDTGAGEVVGLRTGKDEAARHMLFVTEAAGAGERALLRVVDLQELAVLGEQQAPHNVGIGLYEEDGYVAACFEEDGIFIFDTMWREPQTPPELLLADEVQTPHAAHDMRWFRGQRGLLVWGAGSVSRYSASPPFEVSDVVPSFSLEATVRTLTGTVHHVTATSSQIYVATGDIEVYDENLVLLRTYAAPDAGPCTFTEVLWKMYLGTEVEGLAACGNSIYRFFPLNGSYKLQKELEFPDRVNAFVPLQYSELLVMSEGTSFKVSWASPAQLERGANHTVLNTSQSTNCSFYDPSWRYSVSMYGCANEITSGDYYDNLFTHSKSFTQFSQLLGMLQSFYHPYLFFTESGGNNRLGVVDSKTMELVVQRGPPPSGRMGRGILEGDRGIYLLVCVEEQGIAIIDLRGPRPTTAPPTDVPSSSVPLAPSPVPETLTPHAATAEPDAPDPQSPNPTASPPTTDAPNTPDNTLPSPVPESSVPTSSPESDVPDTTSSPETTATSVSISTSAPGPMPTASPTTDAPSTPDNTLPSPVPETSVPASTAATTKVPTPSSAPTPSPATHTPDTAATASTPGPDGPRSPQTDAPDSLGSTSAPSVGAGLPDTGAALSTEAPAQNGWQYAPTQAPEVEEKANRGWVVAVVVIALVVFFSAAVALFFARNMKSENTVRGGEVELEDLGARIMANGE